MFWKRLKLRIAFTECLAMAGLALAVALVAAPTARADYAVLRSGQRLHITGYERNGDTVRLYLGGGTVELPASDIISIEPEDVFLRGATPPPNVPYGQTIHEIAQKNGLDENLISSVIGAESNFNARAVSPKNARGLMQLIPKTAARYSVANPFDPQQNIEGGSRYLRDLLARYNGDLVRALAAYNAGPQRVEQYHGIPPYRETHAYIKRVTSKFAENKKKSAASHAADCVPELIPCRSAVGPAAVSAAK